MKTIDDFNIEVRCSDCGEFTCVNRPNGQSALLSTIKAGLPDEKAVYFMDRDEFVSGHEAIGWNAHNKAVEDYLNEIFGVKND